jgi:predicted RNA-binding protein YlxR (DUF448 family)
VRSCVGCRRRRERSALLRITHASEGIVVDGPSDGRGAWLCRGSDGAVDAGCLDAALARRGFARAWRRVVGPDEAEAIRAVLGGRTDAC